MSKAALTPKQMLILAYVQEHTMSLGYQPSIRDICNRFNFKSPNGAYSHLELIAKKGWIDFKHEQSRAIRFLLNLDGTPFCGFKPL